MGSYAGVQPAGVVVVAGEGLVLDHVGGVIHAGADLAPDLDLLQSHHHGPDSTLTPIALCKQVPKLHSHTWHSHSCPPLPTGAQTALTHTCLCQQVPKLHSHIHA